MPKSKNDAPAGKPAAKGKAKATQPEKPASAPRDSRYLKAARAIIAAGEEIDSAKLSAQAGMSVATAAYCLEAFKSITAALREAGILPAPPPPRRRGHSWRPRKGLKPLSAATLGRRAFLRCMPFVRG